MVDNTLDPDLYDIRPLKPDHRPMAVTVQEGAKLLGVSANWYSDRLRSRKFPGHRLAGRWRLTEKDLLDALEISYYPALVVPNPMGMSARSRARRGTRTKNGGSR